jgi:V/A-type H+-transporting ATPase subunit I
VKRTETFDYEKVVAEVLDIRNTAETLQDERDDLRKAIRDLRPWGDFQVPEPARLSGLKFWFFVLSVSNFNKWSVSEQQTSNDRLVWQEVARDHRNAYMVALSDKEPEGVPGQRVQLDPRPLSQLEARLEQVEEQLEELHHRRVGLTRWRTLLSGALDRADDVAARRHASLLTLDQTGAFALQAWVPVESSAQIRHFAATNQLAVTIEPPAPEDQPPTLLHNSEEVAAGEGLVTFYKTPEYRSWDPSFVVYLSFAIFFAMIFADAGYGLVIGLLAAYFWKRMGQTVGGQRFRQVLITLSVCSIAYGILCGSYFGTSPPPDSLLGKLRLLDASSQTVMMPLTIVVGVLHLSLANLVMARLQFGRASALSSLGWVVVMAGAIVGAIGLTANVGESLAQSLTRWGMGLLIGGLAAVFLFSSERPIVSLSLKNHLLRLLDGLKGLTGISGLFGDTLSYLRLFALGLSSAKLAATFNSLAKDAWDNAGFGVIAAIGILLLGHTLNLLLSIMSGVVHGLRLNCIEFFKWSLPEEGYLFSAFARKGREV